MVQTPTSPETETLLIELPKTIELYVTQEQFAALAAANRALTLERTSQGELIVNSPTGWETGERNRSLTGQLDRWYEENEDLGKAFDSSTGFILPNGARLGWLIRSAAATGGNLSTRISSGSVGESN